MPLLLSEVNDLSLNSSGGFHNPTVVFREIHQLRRERVDESFAPREILAAPPSIHPRTLIIAFSAASIGILSTYTVLGSFGTRQIGYTMGHRCNDLGGSITFPTVCRLAHNFQLQGLKHFKEFGSADKHNRGKRQDFHPPIIISSNHLPTNISESHSYTSEICQNKSGRTSTKGEGCDTQRLG